MHQRFRVDSWALASNFSVHASWQTRDGCTLRQHVHTGVLTLKDATCMAAAASLYTPYGRSLLKQNAVSNSRLMVQWGAKVSLTTGFLSNRDLTHNNEKFFGYKTKYHNILNYFVNIFQKF